MNPENERTSRIRDASVDDRPREPPALGFHATLWLLSAEMYISFCLHPAICGNCGQPARASNPVSPRKFLHVDPFCSLFDLFQAEKCSLPCPGTGIADLFPCARVFEVRIPEWPGPALHRPGFVDRAISGFWVEKCAVSVGKLRQGNSPPDDSGVKQADFSDRLIKILGDFQQFIVRHPDDSRSTCTAVSTLRARELQPVFEPWAGCFVRIRLTCFRHFSSFNFFHERNLVAQCNGRVSVGDKPSLGFRYFLGRPV